MAEGQFTRAMGLVDATAMVVGSMIGSGIFIVSADVARNLGSPGWLLIAWAAAGLLTVLGALCYGEMASMYPHAGGQYVFLREAYGKLAGFLYGWTLFMVIQCGTIAAVAVAFAKFLGVFVPAVSMKNILFSIPLGGFTWNFSTAQLVGLLMVAVLTAINCRGINIAKTIQTSFTTIKATSLALLIILGLLSYNKWNGLAENFNANFWSPVDIHGVPLTGVTLLSVLALAMVGPLFSCDAWNNVTFAGQEVKDAERTLAKSLALGTLVVSTLYILANISYLLLLPLHGVQGAETVAARGIQYAAEERVGTAAAEIIFGPIGEQIMAVAIMISTFGANNSLVLAGPRAYYAMARDGLFFKKCGELSPTTNVPVYGLILQGVWAALLTTSGTYGQLLDYVVFAALLFYVLTVGALIVLRKKEKDRERPFKVMFYPLLPWVYIILASLIMIGQICLAPEFSGRGLLIILSGLPAYYFWHRKIAQEKAES